MTDGGGGYDLIISVKRVITGDFCGANFGPADGYVDVWDLIQFADHWHEGMKA